MELGLVLTLCGLGAAFLIPALVLEILLENQKKRCTKSARAVIVGYEASTQGSLRIRYFPAYEYQVDFLFQADAAERGGGGFVLALRWHLQERKEAFDGY